LINGKNEQKVIEDKLFKFIDKYVLCPFPNCRLPEIIIQIKNKEVRSKCKACGKKSKLDNSHKFVKHILKNPPASEEEIKTLEETKDGAKIESTANANAPSQAKPLDKSVKEKIKSLMKTSDEIIKSTKDQNVIAEELLKAYGDLEADKKYYILIHSLYDCNIFKHFKSKSNIIKQIIDKDSKKTEAPYHLIAAIIDLTIKRYAKDYYNVITKHIPSILYVLYDEDIINEEWYFKFIKGDIKVNSIFYERESFDQFAKFAEEFTKWLETAPTENEQNGTSNHAAELSTVTEPQQKQETKKTAIDIDNI